MILEDLFRLLLRFRTKRIGIIADTGKAFLRVGLDQVDRDVTRFIWLKDINGKVTDNKIQIYRFARLPFGITSTPFLLSATVEHHLDETITTTAKQIKDDIYVDNLITGTNSDEKALQLYKEAKKIFHDASMNLRDWISNSKFVNENTSPDDLMKERRYLELSGSGVSMSSPYQQRNLKILNKQKQNEKFWPLWLQFSILFA